MVHDRDAALVNAGQVTEEACQQDFMGVGGGLVFDQSAVPVRVGCGLGEIPAYVVSNEADRAGLQVNPQDIRTDEIEAGWYSSLGRRYPQAVEHFGIGAANVPSILDPTRKWEQAAQQQGWKVVDWQEPPFTVADWAPYVEEAQAKGVQALETPTGTNIQTYFQAMGTAAYDPAFIFMGIGIPEQLGRSSYHVSVSGPFPPIYYAAQAWPFELASQSPGLEQLISLMRNDAPGDTIDTNDEYAVDAWLLFAKSASACGANLTVSCVLDRAAAQTNWTGGGVYSADRSPGHVGSEADPERLLPPDEGQGKRVRLRRGRHEAERPNLALRPQEPVLRLDNRLRRFVVGGPSVSADARVPDQADGRFWPSRG